MIEKPPAIWLPPKPAIIRAWKREDAKRATFPFPFFVPGQADLFPVIDDSLTGNEIGSNVTTNVTMPAVVNASDLLLVCLSAWTPSAITYTTPTNWTSLANDIGPGNLRRVAVFYKVAVGNEDGTTVNFVTSANTFNAWVVYRISGYTGTPEATAIATSTSSAPNSTSLSPSWGSKATLWITMAGMHNTTQTAQTAPSPYTGLLQNFGNNSSEDRPRTATAHRFLRSSSEDPGAWGASSTNWGAYTIAVRGLN